MCKQGAGGDLAQQAPKINLYKQGVGRPGSSVITSKNLKLTTQAHTELNPGAISSSYSGSKDL